jgi:SAM-dependent methyltransferase
MKRCLVCETRYASSIRNCINCNFGTELLDGFDAYAPDFAHDGGGFKSDYFSELARLEEANFWFQSRNQLILWAIERYAPNFQSMLEIGCGTAYVLSGVAKKFPHATLSGSEIFLAGLGFASARLPSVKFMQMDARAIPFDSEFDVIGAFDVIEHIKEDEQVLSQIHTSLKSEGLMLLTVPQHAWLWSAADDYACHERRYAAADLHNKVTAAGFQLLRSTSFVTALLPAMMVSRFSQRNKGAELFDASAELKISPWLNCLFLRILGLERSLIQAGLNFPVGGSRLIVAKKI